MWLQILILSKPGWEIGLEWHEPVILKPMSYPTCCVFVIWLLLLALTVLSDKLLATLLGNSLWDFCFIKGTTEKLKTPALSLLTWHVSTNTLILYGRKLRLKRLKGSPHSGPQTKAANGKAGIKPPKSSCVLLLHATYGRPSHCGRRWPARLPPFIVSRWGVHTGICDGSFSVSMWLGYGASRQSGHCREDFFF